MTKVRNSIVAGLVMALVVVQPVQVAAQNGAGGLLLGIVLYCGLTGSCGGGGGGGGGGGQGDAIALELDQKMLIQEGLSRLDFYSGEIDGLFGQGTRGSISNYQRSMGDSASGYLSPTQVSHLLKNSSEYFFIDEADDKLFEVEYANTLSEPNLYILQVELNKLGYNAGSPDGKFGRNTMKAIGEYKSDNGWPGPPTATERLLSKILGTPISGTGSGGTGQTEIINTTTETDDQGASTTTLDVATNVETEAVINPEGPLGIVGIEIGMTEQEVVETLERELGELPQIAVADQSMFGGNENLNHGVQFLYSDSPNSFTNHVVALFAENDPDAGVVAVFRSTLMPPISIANYVDRLVGHYGNISKVSSENTWIANEDLLLSVNRNPSSIDVCGNLEMDMGQADNYAEDGLWGGAEETGPQLVDFETSLPSADCEVVLKVSFSGNTINFALWDSSFLMEEAAEVDLNPTKETSIKF